MISKGDFFTKYGVADDLLTKAHLAWSDLEAIYGDYIGKSNELIPTGNLITEHLRQIKEVHSLKMRIKDPEHLIEKIIRKKEKEPEREINISNYQTEITDLVGIRALHLFKDDWVCIHEAITSIWELHESPVANIRKGDPENVFRDKGCEIVEHQAGYRSVHYVLVSRPTKKQPVMAEIQVRTIFEEGWSEIDHQLRYPYETNDVMVTEYLAVFNRLAGMADEMGAFIKLLRTEMVRRESEFKKQIEEREQEKEKNIRELEDVKKKLEAETDEKKKLQDVIDRLRSQPPRDLGIVDHRRQSLGLTSARNAYEEMIGATFRQTKSCMFCGETYRTSSLAVGIERCPRCHQPQY
jgi:putative GTP pyrophosphokinase